MKASGKKLNSIDRSEITPERVYRNRRQFLKSMGIVGAGAILAACSTQPNVETQANVETQPVITVESTPSPSKTVVAIEEQPNTYEEITNYNNYYEFSLDKEKVAQISQDFIPNQGEGVLPWQVEVYGLVNKPRSFDLDDILKFPQEERLYRLRCVEAWSMVIPWQGFPLSLLLNEVEPQSTAKFVRFETIFDPEQMPGQQSRSFPWPYQEGLRLDESMHNLTILATGLYGEPMPAQNGSPLRLVVPWKYGFKSIKSIVKIELVAEQPETLWSSLAPNEYGFYANVNPDVDHPRWSQRTERRIGEPGRRETLPFNGYAEEVASLYEGMDLSVYY